MSRPSPNGPRLYNEDMKTASDFRKVKAPKAQASPNAQAALEMHIAGATLAQVAAHYGVSVGTAQRWCSDARAERRGK